ncbi:MAG: signal peptidase II [Firmicutes bacterium]|nr:signal peptidase II [Bacillota bacterium]
MSRKSICFYAALLIMIEQGIKLIINSRYLHANIPIMEPWLYFRPLFNRDYSWLNSMLQLGMGKTLHIIIVIIALILLFLLYNYVEKKVEITPLLGIAFAIFFAGAFCSLIDKIFWDGSLDYILVRGFFTFDLKDVFLNVGIGLFLIMLIIDHQGMRTKL